MANEADGKAFDGQVVGRLLTYLRPHRAKMLAAFALMLVVTAIS